MSKVEVSFHIAHVKPDPLLDRVFLVIAVRWLDLYRHGLQKAATRFAHRKSFGPY